MTIDAKAAIEIGRLVGGTGNDQGRARFIDEDVIDLVDDGKAQFALHKPFVSEDHIVAQVVEAEFVVGAIEDIGGVGIAAADRAQVLVPGVIGYEIGIK